MSYPKTTWRLLKTPPASGAWNMAVDEAILESTAQGKSDPTLRLFAWQPPCLSLGYAQPFSDVDIPRLQANGWEIVRRATGGRAILHIDELTYSVAGPDKEPRLTGDILTSYRRLSQAILMALEELGMPVKATPKEEVVKSDPEPVCFEIPSNYEITYAGKKLVGSAQARRKGGVLQHGTLPLHGDLTRITQALSFPDEDTRAQAAERLLARATTVETALGKLITWEEAAEAFIHAFTQTLNLDLIPGELTPEEEKRVEELVAEKYGNLEWTGKM